MDELQQPQRKRLENLQKDARKKVDDWGLERLTVPDLLLLLEHDPGVRKLIHNLVDAEDTDSGSDRDEQPQPTIPDPLRQQLDPELALLRTLRADAELAASVLGPADAEAEARQLVRLIANVAHWEVLSDLWDKLAGRCKKEQRPAKAHEQSILRAALTIHNLRWQGRAATLCEATVGASFHHEHHQRGTLTGETIRALWLPGLVNAGGAVHKKPLVQTV